MDFVWTWVWLIHLFHSGTFGKAPWRPPKDLHRGFGPPPVTHNGITLHENPYAAPDTESDQEESGLTKDSTSEQSNSVYEQPFDSSRTDPVPQRRTSTWLVTLCYSWRGWPKQWAFLPHWTETFAIKDSSNVQRVNVKDNLLFLEKSKKECISSCSSFSYSFSLII